MPEFTPDYSTALEHVYLPFARVDATKREVTTTLFTTPVVRGDKWNLKYNTLKRASSRYMKMPCVREMHQARAAGKALSVHFDDATQTATMTLRVVDDAAWGKVEQGVYRGVSIGGVPIITRGTDIEEFDWIETSLVDRPKDPGALFTIARAEDVLAAVQTIELPEGASDEELEDARGAVEEELERLETVDETFVDEDFAVLEPGEDDVARFDHVQPRDEEGKWTIVAGHRISVSGKSIDHNDIHAAKKRFGLSDEATGALLSAHKAGKITNDQHLFRTLSHAEAKAGGLHALTSAHIADGHAHHGVDGSHENHWHSQAHYEAPKLQPGVGIGSALGVHELKTGDVVHFPSHEDKPMVAGVVLKVNPKTVDVGSTVGSASVGVRVKKEHLARPGFVRRSGSGATSMHHVEVARAESVAEGFVDESDPTENLRYHAEAIHAVLSRVDQSDTEEAVNQIAERLGSILRGEAGTALESFVDESETLEDETLERAAGRNSHQTQPRDDLGRWTDGAGKLSVSHVHDVMRHEGIHEDHHHADIKSKIENGELKTRADVLKHIDALHEARKSQSNPDDSNRAHPGAESASGKSPNASTKPTVESQATGQTNGANRPKWSETLKKSAKDTAHAFMNGYRKGKAVLGRAEDGDEIPALVDEFYEGLEEANDQMLATALRSAIAILSGQEPVARMMESADVPARENLEGGGTAQRGRKSLDDLRAKLFESDWDGDREALRLALHSVLDEISRGEGDVSRAATLLLGEGVQRLDLQRMETLQISVNRLEGQLSTVQTEAQATLNRAEVAEGAVGRLEEDNQNLESENLRLREMPDTIAAIQFGSVPLARTFAANEVLTPSNSAQVRRGELEKEFRDIQLASRHEPDASKRETAGARLIVVQQELEQLRRLA